MANQSKNIGHFLAFNKDWFQGHQATLLWLLNNRWTKRWARWILRIRKFDCSINDKILNLAPNSFTFNKHKKIVRVLIKRDGSFQIINHTNPISRRKLIRAGFIDERYERLEFQSTDFRIHPKFAKRIYFAFKYVWWTMHVWDMLIANQWIPEWNFGFDTLTVYPDAGGPGTNSCDGVVQMNTADGGPGDWSGMRNGAGNRYDQTTSLDYIARLLIDAGATVTRIWRSIFTFKTSDLTSGATISAATLSLCDASDNSGNLTSAALGIYLATPTSNTQLRESDFAQIGTTPQSDTTVTLSSWTGVSYHDFALNATGLGNINKTGVSRFGGRDATYDVANNNPGGTNNGFRFGTFMADRTGTSQDPKLVVTYTVVTTVDVTVSAKARIKIAGNDKTVSAKARIKLLGNDKTVTAKSRIKVLGVTKTLSAKANIIGTLSKTVSAKADIAKFGVTQTINAKARIRIADITDTVSAKARILVVNTKTISALARIKNTLTKTVSAKARIVSLVTTTISAKARIKQTLAVVLNAKARILGSLNQTISAKARIFAFPIGIILGTDNDSNLKVGVRNPVLVGLDKSTNIGVGVRLIK